MSKCKICNHQTKELAHIKIPQIYYYCPNCKLITLKESMIHSKKAEKADYQKHENSLDSPGYVTMFEDFIEKAIDPYIKAPAKVLEFGSGPGPVLAHLLKEKGFDVDQYDPYFSTKRVYEGNSYDLITSTDVIEHLKNPLKELQLLVNLLNPGGYLALMTKFHTDNEDNFWQWQYRREKSHIAFYREDTLNYLTDIFDLKIVYCDKVKICLLQKASP